MNIFIKVGMFIGKIAALGTLGFTMWVFSGILSSFEYLINLGISRSTEPVIISILRGIHFIPKNIRECITDPCARWAKRKINQAWNPPAPRRP